MTVRDLEPAEVARRMAERSIPPIDVRGPEEYITERILNALFYPLSAFDLQALPGTEAAEIVFQCGTGMRSTKAMASAIVAGLPIASHLMGSIKTWKEAGLPVISTYPATEKPREPR